MERNGPPVQPVTRFPRPALPKKSLPWPLPAIGHRRGSTFNPSGHCMTLSDATVSPPAQERPDQAPRPGRLRRHAPRGRLAARGARPDGRRGQARRHHRRARPPSPYDFGMDHGAYPASLLYRGYPKSICTSINHDGLPRHPHTTSRCARATSSMSTSPWCSTAGHGDSSRMYCVGEVPRLGRAAGSKSPMKR